MNTAQADPDALLALLDFYVAAGIDCALDEVPHDRFAEAAAPASLPAERVARADVAPDRALPAPAPEAHPAAPDPPAPPPARTAPRMAVVSPEAAEAEARRLAAGARTLEELEAALASFDGCALKASARRLVFADGRAGAAVMIVGDAPGAEEDRAGRPFVGPAGVLLDRMLAAIGLDRTGVYLANLVPWRPPGGQPPKPHEVAICKPFVERQIELARPAILVTLGDLPAQTLLGAKDRISKTRGRWRDYPNIPGLKAMPMLHPGHLLRHPPQKRFAWRDLLALRRALPAQDRTELPVRTPD
jgi:DNA polymerase